MPSSSDYVKIGDDSQQQTASPFFAKLPIPCRFSRANIVAVALCAVLLSGLAASGWKRYNSGLHMGHTYRPFSETNAPVPVSAPIHFNKASFERMLRAHRSSVLSNFLRTPNGMEVRFPLQDRYARSSVSRFSSRREETTNLFCLLQCDEDCSKDEKSHEECTRECVVETCGLPKICYNTWLTKCDRKVVNIQCWALLSFCLSQILWFKKVSS